LCCSAYDASISRNCKERKEEKKRNNNHRHSTFSIRSSEFKTFSSQVLKLRRFKSFSRIKKSHFFLHLKAEKKSDIIIGGRKRNDTQLISPNNEASAPAEKRKKD